MYCSIRPERVLWAILIATGSKVEAATADLWRKYVGLDGEVIGMESFAASAPAPAQSEHFGLTTAHVVDALRRVIA